MGHTGLNEGESHGQQKRQSVVGYAGVYFVEASRAGGKGLEKVYYIRYRKNGKLIEEKVGGQYRDNMTAAKASSIRGLRMEGKDASNNEKRAKAAAAKQAEESRYTFTRLWNLFEETKAPIAQSRMTAFASTCILRPCWGRKAFPNSQSTTLTNCGPSWKNPASLRKR